MTLAEMRQLVGLPDSATDAEVVAAYAAMTDDAPAPSIPLVEPLTVEQARAQCRIDDDIEDALIAQKITSAREWVERHTGRILAKRTLTMGFPAWGKALTIYRRPILSIDAIAFDGLEGDATFTDFGTAIGTYPTRIVPALGARWPQLRAGGGITVAYTAGYEAGKVPQLYVEAIQVLVAGMMTERTGNYGAAIEAAKNMLQHAARATHV
ncbi:hypothetical protein CA234_09695 [Sphingomonas sp. ABOLE]|uniref:head-tail connector protein n=1 Tax=Sphingomonas sp. ABOLE TaxID=1985878 RepID=UPI000F7EC4F8|nr:head-tail connector protein [Sphingomonas sp. ABOLE]RSV41531.1 hypothetical protein CA234_09695 [Sphingomonas sp. ABOLE]